MCGETFLELLPNQYGSEALYFYSANRWSTFLKRFKIVLTFDASRCDVLLGQNIDVILNHWVINILKMPCCKQETLNVVWVPNNRVT